ncbi:Disease resistance protein [Melia azedarach]|uniref:Disease resistance protein n=1 Tax=Melia azedarach TaxID=155640 RepID=A0ACC1XP22_MELAZ|nr:Disease resistance protein [Melia azedarach]
MLEIIFDVVCKVAGCLAPPAERQSTYLVKYKSNFQNLQLELEKLKNKSSSIQHEVDEAKLNGEKIEECVQKWLKCVIKVVDDDREGKFTKNEEIAVKSRCFIGLCPDLKMRYQLSKEAVKQHDDLVNLLQEAESFDRISYRSIPKYPWLSSSNDYVPRRPNKDYVPLQSRMSTLTNILNALSNPDLNMIGICGIHGTDNETPAREVAKHAWEKKLFDRVVFVEVSQHPNIEKIQRETAHSLGLLFSDIPESERAGRLCQRLRDEKKVLIILNNIWERLDLTAIGIPVGDDHKGCKILLAARSVDILERKMDSQRIFHVDVLDDEEAWSLFKEMAGDYIERVEFKSVATDVTKECGGLAFSIATVGRALRAKELCVWKDALLNLRRTTSMNFNDIKGKAYSAIELSYNLLDSKELKNFFLLIGYADITMIDNLLMFGVGLGLFEDLGMEEAQNRLRTFVHKLKDSCMLLEHKYDAERFFMHDDVRDVAISIASRDQSIFLTRNEEGNHREWPNENTPKNYNSIVLIAREIRELPEVLDCPQLKLLSIYHFVFYYNVGALGCRLKISDNFFKMVIELRVLDLTYMDLSPPPSSLGLLKNLRTLCLHHCNLDNMAIIGALEKLEILSIQRSVIKQLPVEVRQLTRLRSLEVVDCFGLKVIPPNVISHLSNLEELRTDSFAEWEAEGSPERRNASLHELKHLPKLTALQICIKDANTLPRDLLFKGLERYKILITRDPRVLEYSSEKTLPEISRQFKLELTNTNISLKDGHIMQLRGIEDLCVDGLQDMTNVLYGLDREGFPELKCLEVKNNPNLLCIIDPTEDVTRNASAFPLLESLSLTKLPNMEKISCGQLAAESFGKLREIVVGDCNKLKNIFSLSIAGRILQLQSIQVFGCEKMEQIFAIGSEDQFNNNNTGVINIIEFGQLHSLILHGLPQLISFCSRSETAGAASNEIIFLDDMDSPNTLFTKKVTLPKLEKLELNQAKVERIWQNQAVAMSCGIQNLTSLIISSCSNLRCLFSSSIAISFVQLQSLQICQCPALEEIVVVDDRFREEERMNVAFPQLISLKMETLQNLTRFCSGDCIEFPSLKVLEIKHCPRLKGFRVKNNISTDLIKIPLFNEKVAFPSLESLSIWDCASIEAIFDLDGPNFEDQLSAVTHLSELEIVVDDDRLREEGRKNVAFPQLVSLKMETLQNLTRFCSGDCIEFPSLKKLKIKHCPQLKGFMVKNNISTDLTEIPLFNGKVAFPRLESLSIWNCTSIEAIFDLHGPNFEDQLSAVTHLRKLEIIGLPKLKQVWKKDAQKYFCFQNLMKVTLYGCEKLKNVFPASIVGSLLKLESLNISRCGADEIVFVSEGGAGTNTKFVFPGVTSLTLQVLPKCTSFYPEVHTTEWPALKTLEVSGWEIVNILSNSEFHGFQRGQLDIRAQQLQFLVEKVFPNLEELIVRGRGIATIGQCLENLLSKPKFLRFVFDKSAVFSSLDFLQRFQSIKILEIGGFNSSETFEAVGNEITARITHLNECADVKQLLKEETNMDHLLHLDVGACHNFVNLVPSSTSFKNLVTLRLDYCDKLRNIVTSSTAKSLVRLRSMRLSECNMMTEVVSDDGDGAKDEIVFSELKDLSLFDLKSLTSFCSGNCTFSFPSLEQVKV